MSVYFSTSDYQFSHGAKPRGRGSWAFSFSNPSAIGWTVDQAMFLPSMTFAEAKREFSRVARMFGVRDVIVYVCS